MMNIQNDQINIKSKLCDIEEIVMHFQKNASDKTHRFTSFD